MYKTYMPNIPHAEETFNKRLSCDRYIDYMLNRVQTMFEYSGLPESIPQYVFELYLNTNGFAFVTDKPDGTLRCFFGGLGGQRDEYYLPTLITIANPYLEYSATLSIKDDGVLVKNDTLRTGLLPLFEKYASALTENDITMYLTDIQYRAMSLITTPDDSAKSRADKYLSDLIDGKFATLTDDSFIDSIKLQPFSSGTHSRFTDLIEYQQYLKGSWYNDIGIQSAYNMKREYIGESETNMNGRNLLPLVDNMLECRKEGIKDINEKYGTSISVKLSGAWEIEQKMQKEGENDETDRRMGGNAGDIQEDGESAGRTSVE